MSVTTLDDNNNKKKTKKKKKKNREILDFLKLRKKVTVGMTATTTNTYH